MTPFNAAVLRSLGMAIVTGTLGSITIRDVQAQGPPNPGPILQLDPLTVTARKFKEPLWQVPFSVDVQTRTQLEDTRALNGESALRNIGGAGFASFGDRSNSFISMRGVAPVLAPLSPDDSSLLTFLDGAPMSIGASSSAYLDLQRMEVLKGPQSTLFGRNTTGGAINLVPVVPSETFEGYVLGEYGIGNVYRLEAALAGAIIPDVLAGRVVFRRNAGDPYIDNIAGPDLGQESTIAGRASLLWTASPSTSWLMSYSGEKTKVAPVLYTLNGDGYSKIAAQNLTTDEVQLGLVNSKIEHNFGSMMFVSQTSLSWFKGYDIYNIPDFLIASQMTGLPPATFSNPATNFSAWTKDDSRFTQEFRLTSVENARIPWLLGLVYYEDKADWTRQTNFFLYGPSVSGQSNYASNTTGQAIFGELTYPVLEKLKVSAGLRLSREEKSFSGQFFSDGTPGAVSYFWEGGNQLYQYWTGRAAIAYEWSPDVVTFANVARGYKPGGFGVNNALMWAAIPRTPYGPSTVMSYEIGGRASALDKKLTVSGAVFFNDVSQEQILSWDFLTFSSQNLNVDTQSYGFEIDANYKIDQNWEISAGTAFTHTALRNVSAQVAAAQPGVQDGNQLPYVPQWTAKAAVGYRASMSTLGVTGLLGDSTLLARLEYNFIGPRYTDAANIGQLSSVNLVSARVGFDWKGKEFYVFGQNLLNQQYMTVNQPFGTSAFTGNQIFGASYARGAVVGVGIQAKF